MLKQDIKLLTFQNTYNLHTHTTDILIVCNSVTRLYYYYYYVFCILSSVGTTHMGKTLQRRPTHNPDSFTNSVGPQYWTWGSHMRGMTCPLSL